MHFQKITVAPKQLFSLPQMIDSGYIFEDESKQLGHGGRDGRRPRGLLGLEPMQPVTWKLFSVERAQFTGQTGPDFNPQPLQASVFCSEKWEQMTGAHNGY